MFCPNCGTQNPETATTCTKCGFNLKGAAAPKFKGTMLMMNSPAAGGAPPPAAPAAPAPPAPKPGSQMKGTIVGVAPPSMGAVAPPAAAPPGPPAPPPAPDPYGAPPGGGFGGPPAGGYPGGVNPMGSTVVAESPAAAFPPPGGFGAPPPAAPPPDAGFGGPPGGGFGGPPPGAPMGGPPGGYGGPPPGGPMGGDPMGAPPPAQFGGPPPGGPMAPMGGAPMVPMGGAPGGGGGPPGTIRNPVMVLLLGWICCFIGMAQLRSIEGELNRFTGKGQDGSILWFIFPLIPLLGLPKLMGEARAKAGTATQGDGSLIMYWLLGGYFIPKDANEIWERLGVRPS